MMQKSLTPQDIDKAKEEGFADFLDTQQTKFMLSLIPEGKVPEAVSTLLRTTYNAGFAHGVGTVVADLAKGLMNRNPK